MRVPQRWWQPDALPAAPVVQCLSLGILTQPLYVMAVSLYIARGYNRMLVLLTGLNASAAVLTACAGTGVAGATEIAWAVGMALFWTPLGAGYAALPVLGRGAKELAEAVGPPVGLLILVGLVALLASAKSICQSGVWRLKALQRSLLTPALPMITLGSALPLFYRPPVGRPRSLAKQASIEMGFFSLGSTRCAEDKRRTDARKASSTEWPLCDCFRLKLAQQKFEHRVDYRLVHTPDGISDTRLWVKPC